MMVEPHQGNVFLHHTFNKVWEFLRKEGRINLETEREGTPFETEANITKSGKHIGKRVISFYQKGVEYARSYSCCWGHYYNCNRTRIGMYCKALDNFIS